MFKKVIKISLIVSGALLFIIVLATLLVSPLAKLYIEKNSEKLVGRIVTIDGFRFNTYTGSLRITGFQMRERNQSDIFFQFDTLAVKIKLLDLLKHKVNIKKVHLTKAYVQIIQKKDIFNFDDILHQFKTTEDTVSTSKKTWEIAIEDIRLNQNHYIYYDSIIHGKWDVDDVNLQIPVVYFSNKSTDIGCNLKFGDGGSLQSKLLYDMEKSICHIHLVLQDFSIEGLLPYLQQSLSVGNLSGILHTDITLFVQLNHLMNSVIKGKVALHAFHVDDEHSNRIVAADEIMIDMEEVRISDSKFNLNKVSTKGLSAVFIMEKDHTNFTSLIKKRPPSGEEASTEKENPDPAPMVLIKDVTLTGSQLEFQDRTLPYPFTYQLKDVEITTRNFEIDRVNDVQILGDVGPTGKVRIHWRGSINDLGNQDIKVQLHNVRLSDFTPYSLDFFAYPISKGNFTFYSQNIIKNNFLNGINKVDIYQCEVDKVRKNLNPEIRIPLRTALYILKDKDDKIDIDLPVTGNIKSPEFSYKKIILKTLVNLMVKVVLSPANFLASSLGFDGDKLKEIDFTPLKTDFTSEQYEKLNQLAEIILSKPDLLLEINQDINYTDALKEQALYNLKQDLFLKEHPQKSIESLDIQDLEEISKIDNKNASLLTFAKFKLSHNEDTVGGEDIYVLAQLIYASELHDQIIELANKRNTLIEYYLINQRQVPKSCLKVEIVPLEKTKKYTHTNTFKIHFSMPGDQSISPDLIDAG